MRFDLNKIQKLMDANPIANPEVARRETEKLNAQLRREYEQEEAQRTINKLRELFK